jgi:broad specificity phosphatase PhoE
MPPCPAPDTCFLYLIRHGATANNLEKPPRVQGQGSDPPLTPVGTQQAQQTGEFLRSVGLSGVYASPLLRAVQTAEAVAAPHGLAVQIFPDVIEVDTGEWDGLNWDEIQREYAEAYHSFMHTPETHGYPGGETMTDVLGRSSAAIEKLMSENVGRSIAMVAHNVVIKCYLGHVLGLPSVKARSLSQKNCAINVLRYRREKIKVITLNGVFHLDESAEKRG